MGIESGLLIAVPAVVAAMFLESAVGRRQGLTVYRWPSLVSDLSCGIASLVGKTVVGISAVGMYAWIEARVGLLDLSVHSPWVWLAGFFVMDLLLYWRHRACHRVGLWWALHAVHHQSPDLNLGTANRVPWLQDLQVVPFVFVGALIGFPAPVLASHLALATVSALLTHTRVVGRLGWLEVVLVTPSHHRVHHGLDAQYLDRNFGAVLVVWDKILGTFEPETVEPTYGTPYATDEMGALRANAGPWADLVARARTAPTWWGAVETLFRPPGWNPVTRREEVPGQQAPADPSTTRAVPWGPLVTLFACGLVAMTPLWIDFSFAEKGVLTLAIGSVLAALGARPAAVTGGSMEPQS